MHRIVLSCVSPELDTHPSGDLFWLLWSGANDYCNIHTQSDRLNPCIWKLSKSRQWAKGLWRDGLGPRWRKYSPTLNSNYNDNATTLRLPSFNRKPLLLLLLLLAAPLVSHFKALKRFAPTPLLVSSWDKFFVNIGRRKMDRWNMTTVYSFNVLRSKGGAPRTIKWSKQQNKSFDVFDWPSFNIFDWPSTEF